jgi:hypothetical protein
LRRLPVWVRRGLLWSLLGSFGGVADAYEYIGKKPTTTRNRRKSAPNLGWYTVLHRFKQ